MMMMTREQTRSPMAAAVCIVALLASAFVPMSVRAEMCGVDSTDPEKMNCNSALGATLYTTTSRAPAVSGLSYDYYDTTCPSYKDVISQVVTSNLQSNSLNAGGIVRILFHDCFVQGCDASILLTTSGSEQSDLANQNLRQSAFQFVNDIKTQLEQTCPNTVSCADIISLGAAEAIKQTGGPTMEVPVGRRDGSNFASNNTVNSDLPSPLNNVSQNYPFFTAQGMDYTDMVTLVGAHTLGEAHCVSFSQRLNPNDPNLDTNLAQQLDQLCPSGSTNVHSLDDTPTTFDNQYYKQMLTGDVVLTSDSSFELDGNTQYLVQQYARDSSKWYSQFSRSFCKLTQLGVLTGSAGEVRSVCTAPN